MPTDSIYSPPHRESEKDGRDNEKGDRDQERVSGWGKVLIGHFDKLDYNHYDRNPDNSCYK